jgi:hypothetical protein
MNIPSAISLATQTNCVSSKMCIYVIVLESVFQPALLFTCEVFYCGSYVSSDVGNLCPTNDRM